MSGNHPLGSVRGTPLLDPDFQRSFESRWIDLGALSLHVVVGGEGPPLLLIPGWPQTWFAWRSMMPRLAELYRVIAVDPRGTGLSDKPAGGYDSGSQAADMLALMTALGHQRFALVGHDMGMWTGFAMAADWPERIARAALGEAIIPGLLPSPPLIGPHSRLNERLWHFAFNRLDAINEDMVRGREALYFGHQFRSKAATPTSIPADVIEFYVELIRCDPAALRASFDGYRSIDALIVQTEARKARRLRTPILAFAGELACGPRVEAELSTVADDLTSLIVAGCGHFVPEEAPEALLDALLPFLDPYRQTA